MKRLSLSLILITLCSIVALGWAIDQLFENYSDNSQNDLISHYQTIGQQLANTANALPEHKIFLSSWNSTQGNQVSIVSRESFPLPNELISDFEQGKPLVLNTGTALSFHYLLIDSNQVLNFTPDELADLSKNSSINLFLTSLFYFGIMLVIATWLAPLITRLKLLRQKAMQFGEGDLSSRIPSSRTSFITDIEVEFNRMANKIETLIADNKLISSAVSHDLKTPLARLRLGLDVLEETDDPNTQAKYFQRLNLDIDEMQSLIEVLIEYARLEQALLNIDREELSLSKLLSQLQAYYKSQNLDFDLEFANENLIINGDQNYLSMLFHNLLENAFKYCDNKVSVVVISKLDSIMVEVHDDGEGVYESHRRNVIKPFVKFDSLGHGLGLAIAERVAHWHQADITIESSDFLGGALFKVSFSRATSF